MYWDKFSCQMMNLAVGEIFHRISQLTQITNSSKIQNRSSSIDLIKWLAISTMLIDHIHYIWPSLTGLFVPGRISYPLFCLIIAANINRSAQVDAFCIQSVRYFVWLVAFSLLSEPAYRVYFTKPLSLNVLPSLTIGFVIARMALQKKLMGIGVSIVAICLAYWFDGPLMYGVCGTLLPAAFLIAIRNSTVFWLMPAVLSAWINRGDYLFTNITGLQLYPLLVLGTSFTVALFGLWLLRQPIQFRVWPVGRWAYFFYPGHLLILSAVRSIARTL